MNEKNIQEKFMKEALKEAKKAYGKLEVPVGAVIVKDGKIIARAHNIPNEQPSKYRRIVLQCHYRRVPRQITAYHIRHRPYIRKHEREQYSGNKTGDCSYSQSSPAAHSLRGILPAYFFYHIEITAETLHENGTIAQLGPITVE